MGIKVAISATGKLDDAWIFYPSGYAALDAAALKAARASTYKPAFWQCQATPGIFLFLAEFNR